MAVPAIACLLVQLYKLIELITIHRAGPGGVELMGLRSLDQALAIGAHCLDSPDADVLRFPACSRGALSACTTTVGCNHLTTIVTAQAVVGGLYKTHCVAMRKEFRGLVTVRKQRSRETGVTESDINVLRLLELLSAFTRDELSVNLDEVDSKHEISRTERA
jgi:hypothetical protein